MYIGVNTQAHAPVPIMYLALLGAMHMEGRGQLARLALSFHHVASKNQAQVIRLDYNCHHPPSHLAGLLPHAFEQSSRGGGGYGDAV